MDSHWFDICVCVVLCTVGVALADSTCTTLGEVNDLSTTCRSQTFGMPITNNNATKMELLEAECRSEASYRACMNASVTAECKPGPKRIIFEEINYSFKLCNGSGGLSEWAERYLATFGEFNVDCLPAVRVRSCLVNMMDLAMGFPFGDEQLLNGLRRMESFKRSYFDCYKDALENDTPTDVNCRDKDLRRTYVSLVVRRMIGPRLFGLHMDNDDVNDIETLTAQTGGSQQLQDLDPFLTGLF